MCGRYILTETVEILEKRFNVTVPESVQINPSFNISPGKFAPVITNERPEVIQLYRFGLTPFWSKKSSMLFINARAEGDQNPEDDPNYKGAKGIITKPSFRKPIRSQRCLIPADAFIEGPAVEKLNKPYVVYLQNKVRPFAMAGIWDQWTNQETGDVINSFAIITTVANLLLQKINHPRSPVILHPDQERMWLSNDLPLAEVTGMLNPYPYELMNAYPVSPAIKNPKADEPGLIQPVGERIMPEYEIKSSQSLRLEGMGNRGRHKFL